MKTLAQKLWTEPVLVKAVLVAALNVALLLPDWRAAVASAVVSLGGGAAVRARVTPHRVKRAASEAGYSLIEVGVFLLLLAIALAILLPLR